MSIFDGLSPSDIKVATPTTPALDTTSRGPVKAPPTVFKLMGSMIFPGSEANSPTIRELPPRTFLIKLHPDFGYYLEETQPFSLPKKVYGDTSKNVARFLTTFQARQGNTGAMLTGEKGGGKSLFAKMTSVLAAEIGFPTLILNEPFSGTSFFEFLGRIQQPCIVLIDEFEKTYHKEEMQQAMLTLLDGVFTGKKYFILTCNDVWRINQHMKNRPGRLFYRLDYKGLDMAFIKEYCQDALTDKSRVLEVCAAMVPFGDTLNFDMLKAVVEEVNRYPGSVHEHLQVLNVRPTEGNTDQSYNVKISYKGIQVGSPLFTTISSALTPMKDPIEFFLYLGDVLKMEKSGLKEIDTDFRSYSKENDQRGQHGFRTEQVKAGIAVRQGTKRVEEEELDVPEMDEEAVDPDDIRKELLAIRDKYTSATPEQLVQTDAVRKGKSGCIPKLNIQQAAFLLNVLEHPECPEIDEEGDICVEWTPDYLTSSSMTKGVFEFTHPCGLVLRLEQKKPEVPWHSRANAYSGMQD